jgi:hypothetical protein
LLLHPGQRTSRIYGGDWTTTCCLAALHQKTGIESQKVFPSRYSKVTAGATGSLGWQVQPRHSQTVLEIATLLSGRTQIREDKFERGWGAALSLIFRERIFLAIRVEHN